MEANEKSNKNLKSSLGQSFEIDKWAVNNFGIFYYCCMSALTFIPIFYYKNGYFLILFTHL